MSKANLTYKDAGVDISKADGFVDNIKDYAKQTQGPEVLSGVGGFAGLFAPNLQDYKTPVLVAATDGIGTKLNLGLEHDTLEGLGQDLVAMCVNDLICCGAKPLFFLDYFATSSLDTKQLDALLKTISQTLKDIDCALLGGETAEMPGLYKSTDFDMAGFSVGVVDKPKIVQGKETVQDGDVILGLKSSGVHSNGFSLVRKIIEVAALDVKTPLSFAPNGLANELLKPTKIYVNPILKLLESQTVSALCHITGGGLIENLPRIFSESFAAHIQKENFTVPPLFRYLQEKGNVPEEEMWRVFNMGIGFVVIVKADKAQDVIANLTASGEEVMTLGTIKTKENKASASVVLT